MEILFYRRQTPAQKQKNTCTIYCRLTIEGQRVQIGSTNVKVKWDEFDPATQQVIENYNSAEMNFLLEHEYKSKIYSIYNNLLLKREPITARKVHEIFNQNNTE